MNQNLLIFSFFIMISSTVKICAQENTEHLSLELSEVDRSILLFKVGNKSNSVLVTSEFNISKNNRVVIKNDKGIEITYRFITSNTSVNIPAQSSKVWEFNLDDFFYPKTIPHRWKNQKGKYYIFWEFNGLISEPYEYEYH